jgi:hypothetical protein
MHRLLLGGERPRLSSRLARRKRADVATPRAADHRGEAMKRLGAMDESHATLVVARLADRRGQRAIFRGRR